MAALLSCLKVVAAWWPMDSKPAIFALAAALATRGALCVVPLAALGGGLFIFGEDSPTSSCGAARGVRQLNGKVWVASAENWKGLLE